MLISEGTFEEEKTSAVRINRKWRADMSELVALDKLERELQDFAPAALRAEPLEQPITQVKSFGELPTRELDTLIRETEEQIAKLKGDAQAVRDIYSKHTARITRDLKLLQEVVKLGANTLKDLRDQCHGLNSTDKEQV